MKQGQAAFECSLCKKLHRERAVRCTACGYPELRKVTLSAKAYCVHFGHDGGEVTVTGTQRKEGIVSEQPDLSTDGYLIGGGSYDVYSYEFLFRCARCGFEKRERRQEKR